MKLLALILALTITVPPLQAGPCDMGMNKGQEVSHHQADPGHGEHRCCDSQDSESNSECDSAMQCGWCSVHAPALPVLIRVSPAWVEHPSPEPVLGIILPSHNTPPFRPPIA